MLKPQKEHSLDDLFSVVYEELRHIASAVRKNEGEITISSTGLVHEAWLKLRNSPALGAKSPSHFKAIAAKAIRQVLVDEARRRKAHKRGHDGQFFFVPLDEAAHATAQSDQELLFLDDALQELARMSARQSQVVVDRFFGGMSVEETSEVLGVSASVVEREWRAARAWLATRVRPHAG